MAQRFATQRRVCPRAQADEGLFLHPYALPSRDHPFRHEHGSRNDEVARIRGPTGRSHDCLHRPGLEGSSPTTRPVEPKSEQSCPRPLPRPSPLASAFINTCNPNVAQRTRSRVSRMRVHNLSVTQIHSPELEVGVSQHAAARHSLWPQASSLSGRRASRGPDRSSVGVPGDRREPDRRRRRRHHRRGRRRSGANRGGRSQ